MKKHKGSKRNDRLRKNRQNKEEKREKIWERKFSIYFKKCTGDKKAKPNALLISQQTKRKPARK